MYYYTKQLLADVAAGRKIEWGEGRRRHGNEKGKGSEREGCFVPSAEFLPPLDYSRKNTSAHRSRRRT